ncbi:MAG TPA: hypothetical protein PLC42_04460 [Parachlamydiaceae bacterium]|nr:hypothetical protein [Parachlamydiaceae bacterium]
MIYNLEAFLAVTVLAIVHLLAGQFHFSKSKWHKRFLSMAGGVAVAYVFVELMPKLGVSETTLQAINTDMIPLKERHVYLVAFLGFLFFYGVHRISTGRLKNFGNVAFWLNMASYVFFNFLVGYEIVDVHDPFIQPLYLFVVALGLHYFITDYSFREKHPFIYHDLSRYILILALYAGFAAGISIEIPKTSIIYGVAFVAGGMILNVLSYELPADEKTSSFPSFLFGSLLYSIILTYQG